MNMNNLAITSPAFGFGDAIPTRHTGEGEDVSPELRVTGVPDGTRQLALICHDPDAPLPHGFTHWTLYGIPPETTVIEEGGGAFTEGANDFGRNGYGGPMPPEGHGPHHYFFFLYALDTEITDGPGLSRADLLARIEGHVVEMNRLVGTYSR